jgi:hypothetical protein
MAFMRRTFALLGAALAGVACSDETVSPPFDRLSESDERVPISSEYGSANFGHWLTDEHDLPAYEYAIDQVTNPIAAQPTLGESRDGWHQVANANIKADAHTGGWVQFWSQARLPQWTNYREPDRGHHSGGWGYLRVEGRTISTLYEDRPAEAQTRRVFGVGYFERRTEAAPVVIVERVYAPFGDDPLVLHDVTIENASDRPIEASWWEYWDVNPFIVAPENHRGLEAPVWNAELGTLSVAQLAEPDDTSPQSIFLSALGTTVVAHSSSVAEFFGSGTRAEPDAVRTDQVAGIPAPPTPAGASGDTLFALESKVELEPGAMTTLRYGYGVAGEAQIPEIEARHRSAADPFRISMQAWRSYVPQIALGTDKPWFSRELTWAAYMTKAASRWDEVLGVHAITQGGYYQYRMNLNAVRDPLEHLLPMIYVDPELARETLRWALVCQSSSGTFPYAVGGGKCRGAFGTASELNFWVMLAVIEYVQATRDFEFLDTEVAFADGSSGTVWEHLKRARDDQENVLGKGPHGAYRPGTLGDTFDLTPTAIGLTESISTNSYFSYVYPALAALAEKHGDSEFARRLRADAEAVTNTLRSEWQPRGWYARGYVDDTKLGVDRIYADAQYWPLLAGVPSDEQARLLVANVQRYLDGIGGPPEIGGPSKIGPMQLPSEIEPDLTEPVGAFPGKDMWWFVNGPLVWALAAASDRVDGARDYAWDVLERLTLANHAEAFPNAWSGVVTSDDTCGHFSPHADSPEPSNCGVPVLAAGVYSTQITHVHAWVLFATLKLAGVENTPAGFTLRPRVPSQGLDVRTRVLGVRYGASEVLGYVRPERAARIEFRVAAPDGSEAASFRAEVNGRRTDSRVEDGLVVFAVDAPAGSATDWKLSPQ